MNQGCRNRRYTRAITAQKFEGNTCMTEKTVWQDEKDFTLDVSVNLQKEQLFPAIKILVKHDDWIFVQDRINHIDRISYKISLKKL